MQVDLLVKRFASIVFDKLADRTACVVICKYEMFTLFKCVPAAVARRAAARRNKIKIYDVTPVRTYETSLRS